MCLYALIKCLHLFYLQAGVAKLNEAKALVAELNSKAEEQSRELAVKQKEADDALKKIQTSMAVRSYHN